MSIRKQFEDKTEIEIIDLKLMPDKTKIMYMEYLEDLIQNDLLCDMWYLLQCAKNKSELFKHEYEQYENKIRRLSNKKYRKD